MTRRGGDGEKLLVIPVLTLWPLPSNGPLTLVLMLCSVPNVLIVMVCNLLLLSIPDRNELAEQEKKEQKNVFIERAKEQQSSTVLWEQKVTHHALF